MPVLVWLVVVLAIVAVACVGWAVRRIERRLKGLAADVSTVLVELVETRTDLHLRHDLGDRARTALHTSVQAVHDKQQYGKRGPVK